MAIREPLEPEVSWIPYRILLGGQVFFYPQTPEMQMSPGKMGLVCGVELSPATNICCWIHVEEDDLTCGIPRSRHFEGEIRIIGEVWTGTAMQKPNGGLQARWGQEVTPWLSLPYLLSRMPFHGNPRVANLRRKAGFFGFLFLFFILFLRGLSIYFHLCRHWLCWSRHFNFIFIF